jgi:hypothetical protein
MGTDIRVAVIILKCAIIFAVLVALGEFALVVHLLRIF